MEHNKFWQYLKNSKVFCYRNARLLVDSLRQNYLRVHMYSDTLRNNKWSLLNLANTKSPSILNLRTFVKFIILAVLSFTIFFKVVPFVATACLSRFLVKSTTIESESDKNILPTTISNHANFQSQVVPEVQLESQKNTVDTVNFLKYIKYNQQMTNSLYLLQAEKSVQHLKLLTNRSPRYTKYIQNTTPEIQTLFRCAYSSKNTNLRNSAYELTNPTDGFLIPFNAAYKINNYNEILETLAVVENYETRLQLEYTNLEKNIAESGNQLVWCKLQQQLLNNNFINNSTLNSLTTLTNIKKLLNIDFTESNSAMNNLWAQNNVFYSLMKNNAAKKNFNELLNETYNYSNTSKSKFYENNLNWYLQKFSTYKKPAMLNYHLMPSINTNINNLLDDTELRHHLSTKCLLDEIKLNMIDSVVITNKNNHEEILNQIPAAALYYSLTNKDLFNFNSLLLINLILTGDSRGTAVNEYYKLSSYWRSGLLSFDIDQTDLFFDLAELRNVLNSKTDQNVSLNTAITQLPEGDIRNREYLKNIYRYYTFMTK